MTLFTTFCHKNPHLPFYICPASYRIQSNTVHFISKKDTIFDIYNLYNAYYIYL